MLEKTVNISGTEALERNAPNFDFFIVFSFILIPPSSW